MGIERFFSSIQENNITNLENSFTYKIQKKLDVEHLLIDFNSIVHITSNTIINDMNYILYHTINKSENNKIKKIIETYDIPNFNNNYKDLLDILTKEYLDTVILQKVKEYVINMLNNFIIKGNLKTLYIAVDGVPNKTKMLEQKKRRYMGAVINGLKNKIFDDNKDDLSEIRYIYEKNKVSWSKIYISPGTEFMNKLNNLFINSDFGIKNYEYSGSNQFGEGEKKIVDYVHKHKLSNIAVYSPDSDMSLLCLILNNYFNQIKIIRHNQQQNNYDIIDIDLLGANLYNYVLNSLQLQKKDSNVKVNKKFVIDDIVFILTIFGNDFLPKIESFDIKYNFDMIIDKYIEVYSNSNKHIIFSKDKQKYLDQETLTKFFYVLQDIELDNLQKKYIQTNYQNYNKLKKILGADSQNFTDVLNDFLLNLRKFNDQIRGMKIKYNEWTNKDFINKLMRLAKLDLSYDSKNSKEFIDAYNKYFLKNNRLPKISVIFQKYSKSIKDSHHRDKLEKTLDNLDSKLKITKYDEEVYKLDNMLDEYVNKLNSKAIELGKVFVDPKKYIWISDNIENSIRKYYSDFFGKVKINDIVNDYLLGLVWVFDYYYNFRDKPSFWFYKYSHSPLLRDIYKFMKVQKNDYIEKLEKQIRKYDVDLNDFFMQEEHLLYVSPIQKYPEIIPDKYKNKLNKLNIDISIDKIVKNTYENNMLEIDCRGVLFLNKCHINKLHIDDSIDESFDKDKQFLQNLKK